MAVATASVAALPGPQFSLGMLKAQAIDITFDNAYVTAGEPFDPVVILGWSTVVYVPPAFAVTASRTTSVLVHFDVTTNKLVVYWGNAGAVGAIPEADSLANLSTFSCRLMFFGY